MEWKRLGIKRKVVSAKQKASDVLRLMGAPEKEDSNVSSPTPISINAPYKTANSLIDHSLEAELKKAEEFWRKWMDRPK